MMVTRNRFFHANKLHIASIRAYEVTLTANISFADFLAELSTKIVAVPDGSSGTLSVQVALVSNAVVSFSLMPRL